MKSRKCAICKTDDAVLRHHVIPKSENSTNDKTYFCCADCGNQVHMLYTNKELTKFGNLETLLEQDEMKKYLEWKKEHPGNHKYRASRKVRAWRKNHRG